MVYNVETAVHYKTLNLPETATDEEIVGRYKQLALQYHPDRNPDRVQWATENMARINHAYSEIMSFRFKNSYNKTTVSEPEREESVQEDIRVEDEAEHEILTRSFVRIREHAKDALYRYFQFSLHNFHQRNRTANQSNFNRIVTTLRKSYHSIKKLSLHTDDTEFLDHFSVFNEMLFNFYRASECINLIDSYNDQYEVDAYRIYRQGDDTLNAAQKEIFYDRHNRGYFKKEYARDKITESMKILLAAVKIYSQSSWSMEIKIKLEHAASLLKYLDLFFQEN